MIKTLTSLLFLIASTQLYATPLSNNIPANNLSSATGNTLSYTLAVPGGASDLQITISGGSGDADLYVRAGSAPTLSLFDCRPYLWGNEEQCFFETPSADTYYIDIHAYESFSGLTLVASYSGGSSSSSSSSGTIINNGQTINGISGSAGSNRNYTIDVPTDANDLVLAMNGGSGDADLYVKFGSQPTTSNYDCRPYLFGNNENCTFATPQNGTYHILIRGYETYSNTSLSAAFQNSGSSSSSSGATWPGFSSYYQDAIGLSGSALLNALNESSARNHDRMSYSEVWEALKYTDEDPNNSNNVILLYTGRSQAKSFNASGNNDPDAWNREHSWPKSHGFPSSGDWGYTDIHHLRPADASVNSARSNKDYDVGGSSITEAPGNYTDSDSFEPRNAVKGDVARMMFYMHVRYDGNDNTGTDDLNLVNYTGTSGANLGKLCTLLSWHNQDSVDNAEIERHARVVEWQGNRNPFIDYPAWANEIWGADCN